MAAVTCYQEWGLAFALRTGEALVIVQMSREKGVRPDSRFIAGRIDLREYHRAGPMLARVVRVSRVTAT